MSAVMNTIEMEIALANYFGHRSNLIVPNVSWGLTLNEHTFAECDLLVVTKQDYLYEVEIKITRADLIADKKKTHGHRNPNIKRLYFAIPKLLEKDIEHIPERAGIIIVSRVCYSNEPYWRCRIKRKAVGQRGYKINVSERLKIAHLGAMRIWSLKRKIVKLREKSDDKNLDQTS